MTLNEFIEVWWDAHPGLEHTVMGQNGQFDELPYVAYEEHEKHKKRKRQCSSLDWQFGSDWVTCKHPDNPTALQVCSYEHCPLT